jgi:Abnormal spindle-like microcephaly-assoc'd, ASPM-SPD-2-Hydin/Fibronectin type III domain
MSKFLVRALQSEQLIAQSGFQNENCTNNTWRHASSCTRINRFVPGHIGILLSALAFCFSPFFSGCGGLVVNSSSAAGLSVSATSVPFGSVVLNKTATQSVTLTSTGKDPVIVTAVNVTGTGFTIANTALPLTIASGQTATLNLQFVPNKLGAASGNLMITTNSSTARSATISLSGTGVSHEVDLSWNPPDSSSDPLAGYQIYRASANSGSFSLLNSSLNTQASYVDTTVQSATTYDYVVKTVDTAGIESPPSNTTTVTIP